MATARGINPFLKAALPTRVLKRRGQSLHRRAPGSSPYDMGAGSHTSCKLTRNGRSQTAARGACNRPAVTSTSPSSVACNRTVDAHPSASSHPAWRPRPTRHVTGVPVTMCKQLHRHLRQCHAFSTAELVPRLEATLRMAQQCQSSTTITGQSAVGGGVTVDMAKSGPAVMAAVDERKQRSNRLQAHVPSWSGRGALSHSMKTTHLCSVPRTTRARATAAQQTARPVALTSRQGKQHLWQAKQASFHLRHNDRVKKGVPHHLNSYPFPLPFSLSCYRDRERGYLERDPSPRRKRAPSPPIDQGFEGWPLGRVQQPPQSTWASSSLLIRGSKAGPSKGFDSRPRALGLRAHY
jgi:dienelactone hydrolase